MIIFLEGSWQNPSRRASEKLLANRTLRGIVVAIHQHFLAITAECDRPLHASHDRKQAP